MILFLEKTPYREKKIIFTIVFLDRWILIKILSNKDFF